MSADAKNRNASTAGDVHYLAKELEDHRRIIEAQQLAIEALTARVATLEEAHAGLNARLEELEACCEEGPAVEAPNEPIDAEIRIATGVGAPPP